MNIVDWASSIGQPMGVNYDVTNITEVDGSENDILRTIDSSKVGVVLIKEENPQKIEGYQVSVTLYTQAKNWLIRNLCAELGWETSIKNSVMTVKASPSDGKTARAIGELISGYVENHNGTLGKADYLCYRFGVCP